MSKLPTLYVGVAAPLVEAARSWAVRFPECESREALGEKLRAFPKNDIGGYGLRIVEQSALAFRTGAQVNPERVLEAVITWGGNAPELIKDVSIEPITPH